MSQNQERKILKILVVQGPNLNLLGKRERSIYGQETLEDIHAGLQTEGERLGAELAFFQSNHEGEILDRIHTVLEVGVADGIIINAGALTHTSVGLRDALLGVACPYVEIHISNVHQREEFRHHSYISEHAAGIVVGFGTDGYRLALEGLVARLRLDDEKIVGF